MFSEVSFQKMLELTPFYYFLEDAKIVTPSLKAF